MKLDQHTMIEQPCQSRFLSEENLSDDDSVEVIDVVDLTVDTIDVVEILDWNSKNLRFDEQFLYSIFDVHTGTPYLRASFMFAYFVFVVTSALFKNKNYYSLSNALFNSW